MNYVSTRNTEVKVSASQAITKGISSEGGLFVPENLPKVAMSEIEKIAGALDVDVYELFDYEHKLNKPDLIK